MGKSSAGTETQPFCTESHQQGSPKATGCRSPRQALHPFRKKSFSARESHLRNAGPGKTSRKGGSREHTLCRTSLPLHSLLSLHTKLRIAPSHSIQRSGILKWPADILRMCGERPSLLGIFVERLTGGDYTQRRWPLFTRGLPPRSSMEFRPHFFRALLNFFISLHAERGIHAQQESVHVN